MSSHSTTKVTLTEANSLIRNTYFPTGGAALFAGPPGCGKSEGTLALQRMMQQEFGDVFGSCFYNMSAAQAPDVMGWTKMSSSPLSLYGVPAWMQPVPQEGLRGAIPALHRTTLPKDDPDYLSPSAITWEHMTTYKYGIAVFDEVLSVADDTVLLPMAQLFSEGRVGQWGVPVKSWARIGLTNRPSDHRDVRVLHAHTRNRMAIWEVHITFDDVSTYWESIGMHDAFHSFAGAESGIVFSDSVPSGNEQFSTARSWQSAWRDIMSFCKLVARLPNVAEKGQPYRCGPLPLPSTGQGDTRTPQERRAADMIYSMVAARCGEPVALKFQDFVLNLGDRPPFEDILADPDNAKVPSHPGVMYAVVDMLVNRSRFDQFDEVFKYARRLGKPMASTLCVRLANKHKATIAHNSKYLDFMSWCGAGARAAIYL